MVFVRNRLGYGFVSSLIATWCQCGTVEPYIPNGTIVPVQISAPVSDHRYSLRIVSANLQTSQECKVPCRLDVLAGSNQFILSGHRSFYQTLIVPPQASHVRIKERSHTQILVGGAFALIGYVAMSGALIATDIYNKETSRLTDTGLFEESDAPAALARRSLITGGVFGGIGIIGSIIALTARKDRVVLEVP